MELLSVLYVYLEMFACTYVWIICWIIGWFLGDLFLVVYKKIIMRIKKEDSNKKH